MGMTGFDSATFRRVLGHYPTGVCVVTAVEEDGAPVGMVVGSFGFYHLLSIFIHVRAYAYVDCHDADVAKTVIARTE